MVVNIRKAVFVIITLCFVLAATNIVLFAHLTEHKDSEKHDCKHCPICKQAVANKTKTVLPSFSFVHKPTWFVFTEICAVEPILEIIKFRIPHLRAPPLTA